MSEKKIAVPEGMLRYAIDAARGFTGYGYDPDPDSDIPTSGHIGNHATFAVALEAALCWLLEPANYLPTIEQYSSIEDAVYSDYPNGSVRLLSYWRQCAMFRKMLARVFIAVDSSVPEPGPFDRLLDQMEADAPAGAYLVTIQDNHGNELARRELSKASK